MTTTPEQIDLWRRSLSEHQRLEFKEARTQYDNEKLNKYCVAIANEGGGILLLGVADKPPRPVTGTSAFRDPVAMAEKLFEALGFRVDIEEVMHPDGRLARKAARVIVYSGKSKLETRLDQVGTKG